MPSLQKQEFKSIWATCLIVAKLKKIMRSKFLFALTFMLLVSCKQEPKTNYIPLDLMSHGIPLTIMAPPEPDVKVTDLTVMKDLTIKKDDN